MRGGRGPQEQTHTQGRHSATARAASLFAACSDLAPPARGPPILGQGAAHLGVPHAAEPAGAVPLRRAGRERVHVLVALGQGVGASPAHGHAGLEHKQPLLSGSSCGLGRRLQHGELNLLLLAPSAAAYDGAAGQGCPEARGPRARRAAFLCCGLVGLCVGGVCAGRVGGVGTAQRRWGWTVGSCGRCGWWCAGGAALHL